MHGVVMDSQRDYKGLEGCPCERSHRPSTPRTKRSCCITRRRTRALHVRAYFPAAMEGDQVPRRRPARRTATGAVLRYVATYNTKFSSSMDQDWLSDDASDFSVARRVLCCYQPLEPEMWLTLAGQEGPAK